MHRFPFGSLTCVWEKVRHYDTEVTFLTTIIRDQVSQRLWRVYSSSLILLCGNRTIIAEPCPQTVQASLPLSNESTDRNRTGFSVNMDHRSLLNSLDDVCPVIVATFFVGIIHQDFFFFFPSTHHTRMARRTTYCAEAVARQTLETNVTVLPCF